MYMFVLLCVISLLVQSTLVCVLAVAFWHSINLHISVGVYVPIGGKKLLTFMDDFNMPAKDTFGSKPPLELIRATGWTMGSGMTTLSKL